MEKENVDFRRVLATPQSTGPVLRAAVEQIERALKFALPRYNFGDMFSRAAKKSHLGAAIDYITDALHGTLQHQGIHGEKRLWSLESFAHPELSDDLTPVNLTDFFHKSERGLRGLVPEELEFLVTTSSFLGTVQTDSAQLSFVLTELVLNAVQFAKPDAKIKVVGGGFCLSAPGNCYNVPTGEYFGFTVSNGTHVDGVDLSLTRPFVTHSSEHHSLGLGLFACDQFLKKSGGYLRILPHMQTHSLDFYVLLRSAL